MWNPARLGLLQAQPRVQQEFPTARHGAENGFSWDEDSLLLSGTEHR